MTSTRTRTRTSMHTHAHTDIHTDRHTKQVQLRVQSPNGNEEIHPIICAYKSPFINIFPVISLVPLYRTCLRLGPNLVRIGLK